MKANFTGKGKNQRHYFTVLNYSWRSSPDGPTALVTMDYLPVTESFASKPATWGARSDAYLGSEVKSGSMDATAIGSSQSHQCYFLHSLGNGSEGVMENHEPSGG